MEQEAEDGAVGQGRLKVEGKMREGLEWRVEGSGGLLFLGLLENYLAIYPPYPPYPPLSPLEKKESK